MEIIVCQRFEYGGTFFNLGRLQKKVIFITFESTPLKSDKKFLWRVGTVRQS